jgi:hypothetical protein
MLRGHQPASVQPARADRIAEILIDPHRTVLGNQKNHKRLLFAAFEIDVRDNSRRGNCSAHPVYDPGTLCDREGTAVIAGKLNSCCRTLRLIGLCAGIRKRGRLAGHSASARPRALSGRVGAIRLRARRVGNTHRGARPLLGTSTPITPGRSATRLNSLIQKELSADLGKSVAHDDTRVKLDGLNLGTTPSRTMAPGSLARSPRERVVGRS